MASLPQFGDPLKLQTLVLLFQLKFAERITELEQSDEEMDEAAYRQALAKASPFFAKRFEMLTREDRKHALELIAISDAVAYAIYFALENHPNKP